LESLIRHDVAEYAGVAMVVVESDLLPLNQTVLVIPLLPAYPAVLHLNPTILHEGRQLVLATRLIGTVRRSALRRTGSVADQGDRITRAVDILMSGI
jgi:toxin CcdB